MKKSKPTLIKGNDASFYELLNWYMDNDLELTKREVDVTRRESDLIEKETSLIKRETELIKIDIKRLNLHNKWAPYKYAAQMSIMFVIALCIFSFLAHYMGGMEWTKSILFGMIFCALTGGIVSYQIERMS